MIIYPQNSLILYEYEYLDHTYSPLPDQYPFRGNIKKKSKFVFFRIYRLREIFFATSTRNFKIISKPTASVASMLKGANHALILYAAKGICLFKTYQLQMKGNNSYVSNLGHNDSLEIIQLSLK